MKRRFYQSGPKTSTFDDRRNFSSSFSLKWQHRRVSSNEKAIDQDSTPDVMLMKCRTAKVSQLLVKPKFVSLGRRLTIGLNDTLRATITQRKVDMNMTRLNRKVKLFKNTVEERLQTSVGNPGCSAYESSVGSAPDEFLMENCNRLNQIYSAIREKYTVIIVLQAQFLITQRSFWKEESISQSIVPTYKKLAALTGIVWIARRRHTCQKIMAFCKKHELPVDSIYLVQEKNVNAIGLDCQPIVADFCKKKRKLLFFDLIDSWLNQDSLMPSKLPMLSYQPSEVYLLKSSAKPPSDKILDFILRLYFGTVPTFQFNIHPMLEKYRSQRKVVRIPKRITRQKEKKTEALEEEVLEDIEQLKKDWIPHLIQKKKNTQAPNGQSIHYLVGNLLKLNYQFFLDAKSSEINSPTIEKENREKVLRTGAIQYLLPVFISII